MADSTTKKNLDIVIRGRNEAKAAMKDANKDISSLGSNMLKLVAGGAAVSMVSKTVAGAFMLMRAEARHAAATQKEAAQAIIESQIEIANAASEIGGALPLVGESVKKAMLALSDTIGLQKSLQLLNELEAATKQYHDMNIRMLRETAIERARLAGASESDIMRLQNLQAADAMALTREQLKEKIAAAKEEYEVRREQAIKLEERWQKWGILGTGSLKDPSTAQAEAAGQALKKMKELEAELAQFDDNVQAQAKTKAAAAGKKDFDERIAAAKKLTDYLANEEERRVAMAQDEGLHLQALAQKYGGDEASIIAETARRIQEIRDSYRDRERQARERENERIRQENDKAFQEAMARQKARATSMNRFEDIIFDATHDARERELRDLKRQYKETMALYAGDEEIRKRIQAAYAIQEAQINQRHDQPSGARNLEVQALSARFLTRAQGRDDPKWVQEMTKRSDKQIELLKQIADKSGITVEEVRLN